VRPRPPGAAAARSTMHSILGPPPFPAYWSVTESVGQPGPCFLTLAVSRCCWGWRFGYEAHVPTGARSACAATYGLVVACRRRALTNLRRLPLALVNGGRPSQRHGAGQQSTPTRGGARQIVTGVCFLGAGRDHGRTGLKHPRTHGRRASIWSGERDRACWWASASYFFGAAIPAVPGLSILCMPVGSTGSSAGLPSHEANLG